MADRNGYIGRAPSDSAVTVARQSYNVSGVTTDFTFTSGYVPGYFDVFVNGVKMIEGSDYTSSDGSTFTILNGGALNGDVIEAIGYKAFNAANVSNAPGNFSVGGELSFGSVAAGSSVSFATTAFNLDGTPDIAVRNFTGVAGTFSGFVAFSTSISVGGTITYEDVENIDSVGLITARNGIDVTGGNVTIGTGSSVGIGTDDPTSKLEIHSDTIPRVNTVFQGSKHLGMSVGGSGGGFVLSDDHFLTVNHQPFADRATDNNLTERVRITPTGEVRVGSAFSVSQAGVCTATEFHGDGSNLTNLPASGDSNDITACLFI